MSVFQAVFLMILFESFLLVLLTYIDNHSKK
ncbi:putative holin-like toxin [Weissella paramesenteroides]